MDPTRLRHILAVARTGSFSRAAEEERITQPALSRSIAAFEQRYGVKLFDRGRRGARATSAGAMVIEYASKLLAVSAEMERSLQLYGVGEAGRVVLGVGPILAGVLLARLAQSMLRSRPGLQIISKTHMPHILLQDLMDDSIDLIVGNPWKVVDVSGVDIKELGQLSLAIIVRSGHPLAGKKGLTLADLAGFPAASGMEGYSAFDKHSGALVCENHFILRELTLQSDCYWQTAVALVHSDIESGKLVKLDMFGRTEDRTVVNLMTRRNRTHSPATIAVAREILKIITDLRDADSGPLAQRRFDGWRQNG